MGHDRDRKCVCVKNHHPEPLELHKHHIWPLAEGGPDVDGNVVWVCPTTHANIHEILRGLIKTGGTTPWRTLITLPKYPVKIARLGYRYMQEQPNFLDLSV